VIGHARWRRRVSLLAAGALPEREREETSFHLGSCGRCREELAGLQEALEAVRQDPVRQAEPPLAASFLLARVQARLDQIERGRDRPAHALRPRAGFLWTLGSASAVGLALLVVLRPPSVVEQDGPVPPPGVVVSDEIVRRMERRVARDQAARYLSDAQDVLVTMAASPPNCEKESGRVDIGDETRRSRQLLARRALLVDLDRDDVASARPVLEDVEDMLREVAALPSCIRPRELEPIHREMSRRHLLMKMDLLTRELLG